MSAPTRPGLAQTLPPEQVHITTDPYTEPFWQAAKDNRLVAPSCAKCGHFRLPPTPFCPQCQSTEVNWIELSGAGTVFSFTVAHGFPGLPDITLVPVVVDLPDAPEARLVTNVIDVDPADVHIGMALKVAFAPIADGWVLPVFRPAGDAAAG
jgi:uncharacterized OB-fold protein